MLAIAERLVADLSLEWAFCDTDSIAIAKPANMNEAAFHARVAEIVAWFGGLNPYGFGGSILKVEDVNFSLKEPQLHEPLFCRAVSAKRYALFNIDRKGHPVLRKASAHGLGHLRAPYDEANRARDIPKPVVPLTRIGVELWQHDLWWQIVSAALAGTLDQVDLNYHPALSQPAISRYAATTPKLLRWFDSFNEGRAYEQQVKPFNFLIVLQGDPLCDRLEEVLDHGHPGRQSKRRSVKPVAPFDRNLSKVVANCFDRETGDPVRKSMLKTYRQSIAAYHVHPESKFHNGDYLDRGTTRRRHVYAAVVRNIGKEANEWEAQLYLGFEEDEQIDYGLTPKSSRSLSRDMRVAIKRIGQRAVARESGVSRRTIERLMKGGNVRPAMIARIRKSIDTLSPLPSRDV